MNKKIHNLIRGLWLIALPGIATTSAVEVSRRADDFVDSVGINAHIEVPASVYNESVVGQLGIRHIRSNVTPATHVLRNRLGALYASYGMRVNLVCGTTDFSPAQFRDLVRDPMFESVEGLNEPDADGPRSYGGLSDNWTTQTYPATLAFQNDLFAAMTADAATAGKAVLSPAMANPANSSKLQSVAADFIAMHSYPAQEMPTGNFLASFMIPSALAMNSGTTPMRLIATETGYKFGGSGGSDISNTAAAKYVPRTFAEYFRLGVVRTYLFEMTDTAGVYNYGLLTTSFAPKPAYAKVKNLLAILSDSTWNAATQQWQRPEEFFPSSLDYTITKPSTNVHHLLLQKANGTFFLVLWQEVPSYNLQSRTDISNPTVPVDVTLDHGMSSAKLYQLDSTTAKTTYAGVRTIRVDVPDEVVILEFTPAPPPVIPEETIDLTPYASVSTVAPKAVAATNQKAKIAVTRTGDTSAALTIGYSVSGSAVSGLDYSPLPGTITIPAGASAAFIEVAQQNLVLVGRKTLTIALETGAGYNLSAARSSTIYFGESRTVVADFDQHINGWHGNAGATTTWTGSDVDFGAGAMKVVFGVNGVDRWINNFECRFASAQDWSAVTKLVFRIKEDPANAMSDIGKPIYFTWTNHGMPVGGGFGASKVPLAHEAGYRTVTIDLGNFPRDGVTSLFFYLDASLLEPGNHTVFLDSMVAVTDTNGVLDDFEIDGVANWTSGSESSLEVETANVDSGVKAMKWTYNDQTARWGNHIELKFALPVDLSAYSTLRFRFKEDAANPASDIGHRIFVDWINNGGRANGDYSAGSFALKPAGGGYRTVEISLAEFKRENVSSFFFYVDGESHANGAHTWYLDNVTVY